MKILLFGATLLMWSVVSAQTLFVQKIDLNLESNKTSCVGTNGSIIGITGDFYEEDAKAVFWTKDVGKATPSGLENSGATGFHKLPLKFFASEWWLGGNFQNTSIRFLTKLPSLESSWLPTYDIDSAVNDLVIDVKRNKMYVMGKFNFVNGSPVGRIFSIDSTGQTDPVGGGRSQEIQHGAIVRDMLYIVEGYPSTFGTEEIAAYDLVLGTWTSIDLGEHQPSEVYIAKDPWEDKLIVTGIFVGKYGGWYSGMLRYDPINDISTWLIETTGNSYTESWGNYMFLLGAVSEINGQSYFGCDLKYLDKNLNVHVYDDNGCIGFGDNGTMFMNHFATAGSIDGDTRADIYVFDTIPFTITSVEEVVAIEEAQIFPNPASDFITSPFDGEVMIINSIGQVVMKMEVKKGEFVDVSSLPTGIYSIGSLIGRGRFVKM